jgi:hypothetical protein
MLPEQVVRWVDHGGAAVGADADHAAQPDPAAALQARLAWIVSTLCQTSNGMMVAAAPGTRPPRPWTFGTG